TIFFTLSLLLCTGTLLAQSVSGVVTDENQVPLPGVNVVVKGQSRGAATDFDGNYQLNGVAPDAVISFSYIGFQTGQEPVNGRSVITVSMNEAAVALDEVVIVGASIKRSDLPGAIVSIDDEVLEQRPVTSINEALRGRASGVFIQNAPSPGGGASIKIRGNNSIQYGGNPIFVIDGIVTDGDFNMTNLNDVASINVLKDASATAL